MASSKTILFLSFHIAKRRLKGAVIHNFLAFFLTRKQLQLKSKSFTIKGQTQSALGMEMRAAHNPQINGQSIKRCSNPSSSLPHKRHLLASWWPLFFICSIVNTFPHQDSRPKKPTFVGTQGFHNTLTRTKGRVSLSK